MNTGQSYDTIVIGAGLAGLAAAHALALDGASVALLERRPGIAGRAYSYEHPALHEVVDSQHVVLGCCSNLLNLCRVTGADAKLRWYDELVFLETNGNRSTMRPGILPAPSHQTMSLLRAPMLGVRDKLAIARGMLGFLQGYPEDDRESFANWLRRTGQTDRAIRHFWEPVVIGALNDGFENCSVKYAGKVFHESFLRSPKAGRLGIPAAPLSDFFAPVLSDAQRRGLTMHEKAAAIRIESLPDNAWRVHAADGSTCDARNIILATNFHQTRELWNASRLPAEPSWLQAGQEQTTYQQATEGQANSEYATAVHARSSGPPRFLSAPITTIHLWYDREITPLDHAVLLDTRIQWIFHKSRIRRWPAEQGSYVELVISASWPELKQSRDEILQPALDELALFFPAARTVHLRKSAILKEARATFSVVPGLDRLRPTQQTELHGLFLAGDWTATEWPSTMEGAVRSGRLAAGAVSGDRMRYMAPELPATGLMRWLSRT
jgi:squalene-associated FAD-dependent desaturase